MLFPATQIQKVIVKHKKVSSEAQQQAVQSPYFKWKWYKS